MFPFVELGILLGLVVIIWGRMPHYYYGSKHIGITATMWLGIYIIGFTVAFAWDIVLLRSIVILFLPIAGGFVLGFFAFVLKVWWMVRRHHAKSGQECTVIVLGFFVEDDQPSIMLKNRLDKAAEWLKSAEYDYCILTGGQGPNECFPESVIMQKYLVSRGLSDQRLFREEISHNTFANINYALEIIRLQQLSENIILVSDGFHLYRAWLEGRNLGLNCSWLPSKTPMALVFSNWVREYFAVLRYFVVRLAKKENNT